MQDHAVTLLRKAHNIVVLTFQYPETDRNEVTAKQPVP